MGYYVSLLTDEKDERLFDMVRKKVTPYFEKWRKGRLSDAEGRELREWMHGLFERYGNSLRQLNEDFAHAFPHSGNVNLEEQGFNFQDNDSMILLASLSREERLGYLMNDLFQFMQAVHEFERTKFPDGVEIKLYGKDQAQVVEFLKSIGVNVQKAALRGYFQHNPDDPRMDLIRESKTLDDLFLWTNKPIDETHPIAQLFIDEFLSLRSEASSLGDEKSELLKIIESLTEIKVTWTWRVQGNAWLSSSLSFLDSTGVRWNISLPEDTSSPQPDAYLSPMGDYSLAIKEGTISKADFSQLLNRSTVISQVQPQRFAGFDETYSLSQQPIQPRG